MWALSRSLDGAVAKTSDWKKDEGMVIAGQVQGSQESLRQKLEKSRIMRSRQCFLTLCTWWHGVRGGMRMLANGTCKRNKGIAIVTHLLLHQGKLEESSDKSRK